MQTKGIRISDKINHIVSVELFDIFKEIFIGEQLNWSILYLYATGNLGKEDSILELTERINKAKECYCIKWEELNSLSHKFNDVMDILIIGSKDKKHLHRYEEDQEMYETCDIVIEMFDSSYWEIFSNDTEFINRLAKKFKDVKFLETDFQQQFKL